MWLTIAVLLPIVGFIAMMLGDFYRDRMGEVSIVALITFLFLMPVLSVSAGIVHLFV